MLQLANFIEDGFLRRLAIRKKVDGPLLIHIRTSKLSEFAVTGRLVLAELALSELNGQNPVVKLERSSILGWG